MHSCTQLLSVNAKSRLVLAKLTCQISLEIDYKIIEYKFLNVSL